MDGYAVRAADLEGDGATLRLIGQVAAGSNARPRVRPGTCAEILTGGNVPPGADTVVPKEQTTPDGERIRFRAAPRAGLNIRRRGEEAARGDVLLAAGTRLGAAEIGACAMVGRARVKVRRLPAVGVLVTGAEVRTAGDRVGPQELRDSNGPQLLAALTQHGFVGAAPAIVPDDPKATASRLRRELQRRDVVIVTGGVSVGRYDYVPEAVRRIGGRLRFHGVSMKPGRPQLYATLGRNRHVFGLPGNPVSVLTGFFELFLPTLRRLAGAPLPACPPPAMRLPLTAAARSKGNRAYFCLARLVHAADGPAVCPVESKGSADLIAATRADGVIVIPKGTKRIPAGETVEFHPWRAAP
jgi:molybdopterin molybdotransferase